MPTHQDHIGKRRSKIGATRDVQSQLAKARVQYEKPSKWPWIIASVVVVGIGIAYLVVQNL